MDEKKTIEQNIQDGPDTADANAVAQGIAAASTSAQAPADANAVAQGIAAASTSAQAPADASPIDVREIEVDLNDIESINGMHIGSTDDLSDSTGEPTLKTPTDLKLGIESKNTSAEAVASAAATVRKGLSANAKEWIKDILCAIILAAVILQFIMPTVVKEHSMENTLQENDYLFVSKKAYTWFGGTPSRGDVIVFQSNLPLTANTNKLLVKRIIAVAGDTVAIKDGATYVNGVALDEPFTKDGYTLGDMDQVTVPENQLFCMGDNRQNSGDSRDSRIGMVDVSSVKGKVVFRLFPFKSFGIIKSADIDGQLQ